MVLKLKDGNLGVGALSVMFLIGFLIFIKADKI